MAGKSRKSTADSPRPDFSNISLAAIKEMHRQGENCLKGTVQLAIAADQRATTLAGVLGGVSAAIMTVAAPLFMSASSNLALTCATLAILLFLFIGAGCAAYAAKPSDFYVAGYEPRRIACSAQGDEPELWILRYATEDLQTRIDANRQALECTSAYLHCAVLAATFAMPAGVFIFLVLHLASGRHFF